MQRRDLHEVRPRADDEEDGRHRLTAGAITEG
jgi:hypothetical protein